MSIVSDPRALAQQTGASVRICPAGAHQWLSSSQHAGWLLCERCGTPTVCKVCALIDGERRPGRLPDVFCQRHQSDASRYRALPFNSEDCAARLLYLGGTAPTRAWVRDDSSATFGPVERAWLSLEGLRLAYLHSLARDHWQVLVYPPAVDAAPLFSAEGRSTAPVVRTAQCGPWVQTLRGWVTLRGAQVLRQGVR